MAQVSADVTVPSAAKQKNKNKSKEKEKEKDPLATLRCANEGRCTGYVYAPAYACDQRHALCVTCVAVSVGRCPLCRKPLPRTVVFDLEQLAEQLLLPCAFRSKGCHFRFPREELVFHQVECRYAHKQCFSQKCNFLGDNKELANHMEKCHHERIVKGTEAEFQLRKISTRKEEVVHVQFLRCHFGDFWIKYLYSGTEKQLYGAVQYIGPKQEAEKLEYQFEMQEYDDNKLTGLKSIYTGKMHTHVKSFETIFSSLDCFTVTLEFAQYFENNDVLHLIVRVKPINYS